MPSFRHFIAGAVLAVGALTTVAAAAHGFRGGPSGDLQGRIDHMARELNLTDGQTTRIKAIADADAPKLKALRDQIREHRQSLRDKLKSGFDEATAREESEAIGKLVSQAAFLGSQMKSEMYAVLTPEQKAELDKRVQQRRDRWEQRGDHWHKRCDPRR